MENWVQPENIGIPHSYSHRKHFYNDKFIAVEKLNNLDVHYSIGDQAKLSSHKIIISQLTF